MSEEDFANNPELAIREEKIKHAKRIIRDYDKTLHGKIFQNMQSAKDLILHPRENVYGAKKVVQAQFATIGCLRKRERFVLEL
ncbi:MAG: hypothetical protein FWC68_00670 [Oscillospiraceae bacterium]|nr:hypothetical protein [Oscillospiraceae bacterium]